MRCRRRLRHLGAGSRLVAEQAGLGLEFGLDYAETLNRWRRSFVTEERHVRGLGFDARFMCLWEFYLAYCEAGFASGSIGVAQFTLRHL